MLLHHILVLEEPKAQDLGLKDHKVIMEIKDITDLQVPPDIKVLKEATVLVDMEDVLVPQLIQDSLDVKVSKEVQALPVLQDL